MLKRAKIPIAVMIGAGSKLPAIVSAATTQNSNYKISLVVSHKSFSPGVEYAIKNKIPAVYFKLPDFRKRLFAGEKKARSDYMQKLAWFITQKEYAPKLLVFAGWDLIMDENFFHFFKSKIGNGYAAINLHPALLPNSSEKDLIKLPDSSISPVIKGQQQEVLKTVLKLKLTYFGPSVHFMLPTDFDTGILIKRQFISVGKKDNIRTLIKKLMPQEDKILRLSIIEVCNKL